MIVSTSDNSDPARINFRILRTDSLEKKPDSSGARSGFGGSCVEECVADFIPSMSGVKRRLGDVAAKVRQSANRQPTSEKDLGLRLLPRMGDAPDAARTAELRAVEADRGCLTGINPARAIRGKSL